MEGNINTGLKAPGGVTARPLPTQLFQESVKLNRFISKLLSEALNIEADEIVFSRTGEALNVALNRAKQELKCLSLKSEWLEPIGAWLLQRFSVFLEQPIEDLSTIKNAKGLSQYTSAVRVGQQLLAFSVTKKGSSLTLSKFHTILADRALEHLGLSAETLNLFNTITSKPNGLLVVVAPDEINQLRSVASILSFTGFDYAGPIEDITLYREVCALANEKPVVASLRGDDVITTLSKLREYESDFSTTPLIGLVCQGFVRKVCPTCGREAVIDHKLLGLLPDGLRPKDQSRYRVGRGCGNCGHTGYHGLIGIQNLLAFDQEVKQTMCENPGEASVLKVSYHKGTQPLLADGISKAIKGLVTLESVYGLSKVVPAAYLKYLQGNETKIITGEEKIAVDEGYFALHGSSAEKPLSGRAAYSGRAADAEDGSSPLFKVGAGRKVRAKPLLLIVEDDPDQQSILEMVLKSANYEIVLAANGVDALEKLAKDTPDLIITDLMMPKMDGREFVRSIKDNHAYKNIPLLVLTVISDAGKEYDLLDLGADDYCEKTIQRKILLKRVENLLRRRGTP